jgi:hypothetical protein
MGNAAMVLKPDNWSGKIKHKVEIGEFYAHDEGHCCNPAIALPESCLRKQSASQAMRNVIHKCPSLRHSHHPRIFEKKRQMVGLQLSIS